MRGRTNVSIDPRRCSSATIYTPMALQSTREANMQLSLMNKDVYRRLVVRDRCRLLRLLKAVLVFLAFRILFSSAEPLGRINTPNQLETCQPNELICFGA